MHREAPSAAATRRPTGLVSSARASAGGANRYLLDLLGLQRDRRKLSGREAAAVEQEAESARPIRPRAQEVDAGQFASFDD